MLVEIHILDQIQNKNPNQSYSHLRSQEPCKEEEDKATLIGCEAENLVEEKATLVSLREDGNMKNMDDKVSDFLSIHLIHGILKRLHLRMRTAE